MIGLRPEHFIFMALGLALFSYSERTARFGLIILPYLLVGVIYDNVRLVTALRPEVHVADLFYAELKWFGVQTASGLDIWPNVLARHTAPVLDFFCGLAYITYLPETFLLATLFFFVDRPRARLLGWGFFWVNVAGILTWMLYPAAPPWYVEQYGLGPAVLDALPSAAGAARFDALVGLPVFEQFYSRNANVFGAMPSLHCAYPTLAFLVCRNKGLRYAIPTASFALLVIFSAVYLQHHYVWDVVVGVFYAAVSYFAVRTVMRRAALPEVPVRASSPEALA